MHFRKDLTSLEEFDKEIRMHSNGEVTHTLKAVRSSVGYVESSLKDSLGISENDREEKDGEAEYF